MFHINEVSSPRCNLRFGFRTGDRNHISVITGPNGSGKTEILKTLSDWFARSPSERAPAGTYVDWNRLWRDDGAEEATTDDALPPRVIAQTFSPFSRFAPPRRSSLTIFDVYANAAEHANPYRSIGIHRGSRFGGGLLGRNTLEQGIFRLSEAPEQAKILGYVLDSLGFEGKIRFTYRNTPLGKQLFSVFHDGQLSAFLAEEAEKQGSFGGSATLQRETRRTNVETMTAFLESVLHVLQSHLSDNRFEFVFDFKYGRASEDYAVLQALSVLRRLQAVLLDRCILYPRSHDAIDLADASSGQQQMLCSLFGLYGELRSNSLVLIDEPELSLHPTWQMEFLDKLQTILLPFDGCHVIIATHSPLIVQRALMQDFEVIQLRSEETGSPADALMQRQAAVSVEGTLLDVFGTPITGSVYLANEIFELVAAAEAGNSTSRAAVSSRLHQLAELYGNSGAVGTRQGDLEIIKKALRLVADAGNDSYGV